jgi:hypothetical protein
MSIAPSDLRGQFSLVTSNVGVQFAIQPLSTGSAMPVIGLFRQKNSCLIS